MTDMIAALLADLLCQWVGVRTTAASSGPGPPACRALLVSRQGSPSCAPHPRSAQATTSKCDSPTINTPYGDAQLDPVGLPQDVRQKLVWQELSFRMSKGLQVKGRILNPTIKGYAVAVAGYVALLPHDIHKNVHPEQLAKIGVLQDFYVHKMEEGKRITLSSETRAAERHGGAVQGVPTYLMRVCWCAAGVLLPPDLASVMAVQVEHDQRSVQLAWQQWCSCGCKQVLCRSSMAGQHAGAATRPRACSPSSPAVSAVCGSSVSVLSPVEGNAGLQQPNAS